MKVTPQQLLEHVRKLSPEAFIFVESSGNVCISTCTHEVRQGKQYVLEPLKIDALADHL